MKCTPMLMVENVPRSAAWYTELLGATNDHGLEEFDQIVWSGAVLLMLHRHDEAEHGLSKPADGERLGVGVVLWFEVPDLNGAYARAARLAAEVVAEPWTNDRANWREFSIRDLDGYIVTLHD